MSSRRALPLVAAIVAIALLVVAVVYWIEPAGTLPAFFPGHEAGSGHHHVKHGIAAFVVALGLLAYAWFRSGAREPPHGEGEQG